jgi:hypothetical protein
MINHVRCNKQMKAKDIQGHIKTNSVIHLTITSHRNLRLSATVCNTEKSIGL